MTHKKDGAGLGTDATNINHHQVADILNDSADRRHSTPTAEERRAAQLRAELSELGYTVSTPCLVCSHPLTTERSVELHVGPKCRAKAVQR